MAENDEKNWTDYLKYLDTDYDLDLIIPGPNRDERNKSRLDNVITGKQRPADHLWKESQINAYGNVGIPLLLAFMNYASKGGKALKGAKIISEEAAPAEVATANFGPAIKRATEKAGKEVKDSKEMLKLAKKAAKEKEPKNLFLKTLYWAGGGRGTLNEGADLEAAKNNLKSVKAAADIITSNPPGRLGDAIDKAATKSAEKTVLGTTAAKGAGKVAKDVATNKEGGYDKGVIGNDDRLEMGLASKAIHFLKSLTGGDELDSNSWPMETIDDLIHLTNAEVGLWDTDQLNELDNKEKVRFVMDMARGRYNTKDYDVKNALLKSYIELTEGNEE